MFPRRNPISIGGRMKEVSLNNHIVSVITPKKKISYEEGEKRIEKIVSKIKKSI